jgi:branched-chain amino acid transport system ATP-binding protein
MSQKSILEVNKITKIFGGVVALNQISIKINQGEILGIIGPNGSGKTTLINCISGFVKPDAGDVYFNDKKITGLSPFKIADMGIGRTFQIMRPFHTIPAYKNIVVTLCSPRAKRYAGLGKMGDRDAVAIDILEDVGFERDAYVPYKAAGSLPLGYLKRMELARCIALRSDIILCDEVLSGLSAAEIQSLIPLIERLNEDGISFIMIEHRLKELFSVANQIVAINYGEKIFEGNPDKALKDKNVMEAYFGK